MAPSEPLRVAVIGAGLIGGSIALRLASESAAFAVAVYDQNPQTRALAAKHGIAVEGTAQAAVADADLVFVAVPPRATAGSVVAGLRANPTAVVADVASVKQPIVRAVAEEVSDQALERYVPTHPLAGAETSGFENARPDLLDGSTWAVCPTSHRQPLEHLVRIASVLEVFDGRLIPCSPEQHDRAVARTSHAAHLLAEVVAASLDGEAPALSAALSGGGFRDLTRIAGADFALWSEILEENWHEVRSILLEWGAELQRWGSVDDPNDHGLEALWQRGTGRRRMIENVRWSEITWHDSSCAPTWEALLELGRAGVAIRRARLKGNSLHFQRSDDDIVDAERCCVRRPRLPRGAN